MSLHQGFPIAKELNSHMPRNAEEMNKVQPKDLVSLVINDEQRWAQYIGNGPNTIGDEFLVQGDNEILYIAQSRNQHKYDSNKGVIILPEVLADTEDTVRYKCPSRGYQELSDRLKLAGIWIEQSKEAAK